MNTIEKITISIKKQTVTTTLNHEECFWVASLAYFWKHVSKIEFHDNSNIPVWLVWPEEAHLEQLFVETQKIQIETFSYNSLYRIHLRLK